MILINAREVLNARLIALVEGLNETYIWWMFE
jgi:hypothetical protein